MYNCCSVYNPPGGSAGGVTGSGTLNYVSKWTPSGTALGDSQIYDNGTSIGVNTTTLTFFFNIVKSQNANTTLNVLNSTAGTASRVAITATSEDNSLSLNAYSSLFSNTYLQNNAVLFGGKRALRIISDADGAGSGTITFGIGSGTPTGEFASVNSSGNWSFYGPAGTPAGTARLNIVGTPTYNTIDVTGGGSTSSTYTAIFKNASSASALEIKDDGAVGVGVTPNITYRFFAQAGTTSIAASYFKNYNTGTSAQYAVIGEAIGTNTTNYGVYSEASGGTNNYAFYGNAGHLYINNGRGSINIPPNSTYRFYISASSTDDRALFAKIANTSGTNYGAITSSTGTSLGENIGIYSEAINGAKNYAGMFDGTVAVGYPISDKANISDSALLDLASTTKGFRLMRMTATQASAITATDGLQLYVTNTNATFTSVGFWGYVNGAWTQL